MNNLITSTPVTMSSREIADLTGKAHGNVMRDIRAMMDVLGQDSTLNPVCKTTTYAGANGQVYDQYELDKDTCLTLLLGYDAAARMRVVKRWQELEQKTTFAQLPDFNNPAAAARAWAEQVEQRQQLALENQVKSEALALAAPKVVVHDRIADAEGSVTIRETANTLRTPERKFVLWLLQNDWCYRRAGHKSLLAYADKVKAGYLVLKQTPIRDAHTGEERLSEQVRVTPMGLTVLARRLSMDGQQGDVPVGILTREGSAGYASRRS